MDQAELDARVRPGSRILDIGGATGVHAAPLASLGHEVVLIDPVPVQVQEAARRGTFEAVVGDARDLRFEDDSFDVALMFGPLYHLATREDRLLALVEARRVVRPGGWVSLLEHGAPPDWGRFPGAHFHTAEELDDEFRDAGLVNVSVCAVEGPDGFAFEQVGEVDEELHQAALRVVRAMGHLPGVRDLTNHLMGIAQVQQSLL